MNFQKLLKPIVASLFTAIICVATLVIQIPLPATGGYVNLGDCFVLISGIYLGAGYGALAAGLGSALTDLLSGYAQYAPATFVIKALMAVTAYYIYKISKRKHAFLSTAISSITAETIMVFGYFSYEWIILKYGAGAVGSVIPNIMQGIVAVCIATPLCTVLNKVKAEFSAQF